MVGTSTSTVLPPLLKRHPHYCCYLVERWDTWTPTDPATLAEAEEREEEEDRKRSKEFEENNPQFCKEMVDDMKTRSEARRVHHGSVVLCSLCLPYRSA